MNSPVFESLLPLDDVCFHAGAGTLSLDSLEKAHCIAFPEDHRSALFETNGAEVYAGYVRLFGVETENSIDLAQWNDPECWKFAWNGRCSNYWCFAETAWGDQYAYQIDKLRHGDTKVYFLDCLSMAPIPVAESFSEFMEKEFIRSANCPYDKMIIDARQKFGELDIGTHLTYSPSVLLGGKEDINNVQKMNARSSMICNGDISIQLDSGPQDRTVKTVMSYEDEAKRMRLRLVWS